MKSIILSIIAFQYFQISNPASNNPKIMSLITGIDTDLQFPFRYSLKNVLPSFGGRGGISFFSFVHSLVCMYVCMYILSMFFSSYIVSYQYTQKSKSKSNQNNQNIYLCPPPSGSTPHIPARWKCVFVTACVRACVCASATSIGWLVGMLDLDGWMGILGMNKERNEGSEEEREKLEFFLSFEGVKVVGGMDGWTFEFVHVD